MLSVTLASRQQSRCLLQMALSRASTAAGATNQQNGLNKSLLLKQQQQQQQQQQLPLLSGVSSSLVPQTYFSTCSSRAMSGAGSDHVKMWTLEKVVSFMQIPCFIVPFMLTNPVTDAVFCTLLVLHSHWGKTDQPQAFIGFNDILIPFFLSQVLKPLSWTISVLLCLEAIRPFPTSVRVWSGLCQPSHLVVSTTLTTPTSESSMPSRCCGNCKFVWQLKGTLWNSVTLDGKL